MYGAPSRSAVLGLVNDGVQAGEDASVVHHDVEPAKAADRGVDRILHRGVVGGVVSTYSALPPLARMTSSVGVKMSPS